MCFSQSAIEEKAKVHLQEMDDVVHFTAIQKLSALNIFMKYVEDLEVLNQQNFETNKEYFLAKSEIYLEAKNRVYELCSAEQLEAYKKHKEAKALEAKEKFNNR